MKTSDPVIQGLMGRLEQAWPRGIPFNRLNSGEFDPVELAGLVLRMYAAGIVELRLRLGSFCDTPGERPEASRLARLQLEQRFTATNLRHADVPFEEDDALRLLVRLLDGTRDRAALIRELGAAGWPVSPEQLETILRKLARSALLVA